jgi:hypothetical protein
MVRTVIPMVLTTTLAAIGLLHFIRFLRGYSGVYAGEGTDSCGAGLGGRFRPPGETSCPDPQV